MYGSNLALQTVCISDRGVFPRSPGDGRAAIEHIKAKPYYRPVIEEPDPVADNISTRMWKHRMKTWVELLKRTQACDPDQRSQHEDAAPDVMAGTQ